MEIFLRNLKNQVEILNYFEVNVQIDSIIEGKINKMKRMVIRTQNFRVVVSGSGSVSVGVVADRVDVDLRSSGGVKLVGSAVDATLTGRGSGMIQAEELMVKRVQATVSGSASVWVNAVETLMATVTGSGSVRYRGTPQVTQHVLVRGTVAPLWVSSSVAHVV